MEILRVSRGSGSHIFRHSAHRWQQVCHPYALAALYSQVDSWYAFLLETEAATGAILWLEELGKLKKNPSHRGLEPMTRRSPVQVLNLLCYHMPPLPKSTGNKCCSSSLHCCRDHVIIFVEVPQTIICPYPTLICIVVQTTL
jgi:hypothetical protein